MAGSTKRARLLFVVLAAIAALSVGVSQGIAGKKVHKTFQSQNTSCAGVDNGNPTIGEVDFGYKSDKKVLNFKIHMKGALPSTTYTFYLLDADTCTNIGGAVGTITTKSNGRGHDKFKADVTGHKRFVLNANDGTNDNYSRVADFS